MRYVLSIMDYPNKDHEVVGEVDHSIVGKGDELFDQGEIPNR